MSNKVIDKCNICGCTTQLSEDHVPPQCCSNVGNVKYYALFDRNFQPTKKPRQAQNGIKFKTICSKCNNERLGQELDPYLGEMQNDVINIVSSFTTVMDEGVIDVYINKISRCVIGHMLAAFPHYIDTDFENKLRDYFFDKKCVRSKNSIYMYGLISKKESLLQEILG